MKNIILGQVLGSVFGRAMQRRGGGVGAGGTGSTGSGGFGGGLGGAAAGSILGGVLGRRAGGGRGMLLAMLLPYAMQWVQRNGGLGALLKRAQDKGYGRQSASWVATGDNEAIDPGAVDEIVGRDELSRLSQQLGVSEAEVKDGFAEILPEMVDQLTPDGRVSAEADEVLRESIPLMEEEVRSAQSETTQS